MTYISKQSLMRGVGQQKNTSMCSYRLMFARKKKMHRAQLRRAVDRSGQKVRPCCSPWGNLAGEAQSVMRSPRVTTASACGCETVHSVRLH
jgi:hypothetical protein